MSTNLAKSVYELDLGLMPYIEAWQLQKDLLSAKTRKPDLADIIMMVEHPPVVTLGRGGKRDNLLVSLDELKQMGIEFFHVERGGDATFHGPGQQVIYFIFFLDENEMSIADFVYNLEEVVLLTLNNLGIKGCGRSSFQRGVFVDMRKIASVGIAVKDRITYHGIALNNDMELEPFHFLNPCGISGTRMTSIKTELGKGCPSNQLKEIIQGHTKTVFNCQLTKLSQKELAMEMQTI